ncbi:hypothetical protein EON83_24225 [bacterium]|nr:MAG: hypothetical protein EON83_24225 [bacterium]
MYSNSIYFSGVVLAAMLAGASCASAAPSASWRFDQTHQAGANFKALVGPDVPITGTPKYITDAQGESLSLDNQSLTLAERSSQVAAILPQQNITVSMWVSLDEGREWGGLMCVMQDTNDFERGWVLGYNESKFTFGLTSTGKKRMTYLAGKTSFVPGRWYHLAATYDGKTMSLYVNGQLEAQSTEQSGPILYPEAMPFVIGTYRDDNENFPMQGRLREAQLSKEVLTPQQIAAQFQPQATLIQLPATTIKPAKPVPGNKKVLLIGTDGTRPDKLEAANTPNIHALMNSGAYTGKAQTRMPTVSGPGWSSMLTGVWSDKHGVKNNAFTGKNYGQYPDFLTRLEKLNPKFSTFAAADWEPLLTTLSGGPLVSDNVDVKLAFKGNYEESDKTIAELSAHYLAHENVDAAFVYFGDLDEIAHSVGPLSPRYTTGLEKLDKYVGQLVAAIRSRPTYAQEDWLILMSTDHGHVDRGGHGGPSEVEKTIFFLANGPSVDKTKLKPEVGIVDVGITALAHLGIPTDPTWNLDGQVQALKSPPN